MPFRRALISAVALLVSFVASKAGAQNEDAAHREIFRELVEINTSPDGGDVSRAARLVAGRLIAAGYPETDVRVIGPHDQCLNVVATLRGQNASSKPILLLAHLDVVPAKRSDWTHDPYVLRETDGWFYGRGAIDNKAGASVLVADMVRWKRERFTPDRDVVLVLTCDEETSAQAGMQWLVANVPAVSSAEYALNTDAGEVTRSKSGHTAFNMQAAEKVYASFTLEATNPGGHSSIPRPDNAIYALAAALGRLSKHVFPVQYHDVTRTFFARSAQLEGGELAQDLRAAGRGETSGPAIERLSRIPHLGAGLRTTCVATMLTGGHAENALPQSATATVNCRVFPGVDVAEVQRTLVAVVADSTIRVNPVAPATPSPPSPLRKDLMPVLEQLAREFWAQAVVIPGMSAGATDGLYLRNAGVPVYGVSGILMDPADDRSHGLDERVPVKSLFESREFWYQLVKRLTTPSTSAT